MARDTSGEKYLIFKEMGESIDMTLCVVPKETPEKLNVYLMDHSKRDGIAAFDYLLAEDGMKIKEHPQMKGIKKPSLWSRIQLMREHMRNMPKINYPWKQGDFSVRGFAPTYTYALFDEETTTALLNHARDQKVSLNALLLSELNKVSIEHLMTEAPEQTVWTIPLNMRGGASEGNAEVNTTASISLIIPKSMDTAGIDAKIKSIYMQGVHWGAWLLSNITGIIGLSAFRYLVKKIKPTWVGVFSNMGSWPANDNLDGAIDDGRYYVCNPPATFILPVTTATITWYGRLSLSLQLHPSICKDPEGAKQVLAAWVDALTSAINVDSKKVRQYSLTDKELKDGATIVN